MYKTVNGKTLKTSSLTDERYMQMIHNGYMHIVLDARESAQEAYDRLAQRYGRVRIYSQSTRVRGYRSLYAMVK